MLYLSDIWSHHHNLSCVALVQTSVLINKDIVHLVWVCINIFAQAPNKNTLFYSPGEELSSQPLLCAMLLHLSSLDMLVVASIQGMVVWFCTFFYSKVLCYAYPCYFVPINRFLNLKISCYLVLHLTECTTSYYGRQNLDKGYDPYSITFSILVFLDWIGVEHYCYLLPIISSYTIWHNGCYVCSLGFHLLPVGSIGDCSW